MKDNYAAVRQNWRERFLAMDHVMLAKRFHGTLTEDALTVCYFTFSYHVSRRDGSVCREELLDLPVGFNEEIDILNMFHYAVETPLPSGKLVPFRDVKRAYPFETAYKKTVLGALEKAFTGHTDALKAALHRLHARPLSQGDAGGVIDILPGLGLGITFWDADDEFPAQANMLFDANITDFMHEENVVGVASDAVRFLTAVADITHGNVFGDNE